MFKLKNTIKTGDWNIVNGYLYKVENKTIFKCSLNGIKIKEILKLDNYWGITFKNDFFNVFTAHSENTIYNYNGEILYKKNKFSFYHFYSYNNFIGYDRKLKKVVNSDNEIIFDEKFSKRYFFENKIFFSTRFDRDINLISLTNPQTPLWQFDLSQLGTYYNTWDKKDENYRVEKFIGIYNDILYVALNLYSETIIAIDIKTGKLLNQWQNIPYISGANLDTEKQQIFGFIKKKFWQINLETAEFTITDIHPLLQNIEFENVRDQISIPITDKHYVIKVQTPIDIANKNRIYDSLALFNKNTQQMDWHYLFGKETWLASNDPKITKDKIFQLSNEGNLFIFEKTSNENV